MIEIEKTREILMVVVNGYARLTFNTSTGSDHPYVLDGTPYLPGADTWSYNPSKNQIVFQGSLCAQLKNNTPQNPVTLDIRILQVLH